MKVWLLVLALLFASAPAHATSKVVAADLTDNFVGISEGFEGAKLTIFGLLKNKADAVIVIEGPAVEAKVRAKTRQFGVWVNGDPETIAPVPSFYAVASSRPVEKIMTPDLAQRTGLDSAHLPFAQTAFGQGYVDVKKKKGLFLTLPDGVRILESNLFRADIRLPTSVPIGTFTARIYEFSDGQLTAERTENFFVAQVGLNARLNAMAHGSPMLYAFMCLVLSLGIGGGSAYIVKRMS